MTVEPDTGLGGFLQLNDSLHTPVDLNRDEVRFVVLNMARTREEMVFSLYELCVAMLAARNFDMLLRVQQTLIEMQGWNQGSAGLAGGPGPNDPPIPTGLDLDGDGNPDT